MAWGLPPRVRGKGTESAVGLVVQRITPACAGKSHWESLRRSPPEDHPRVCGEKVWLRLYHLKQKGSPPRVRGKGGYRTAARRPLGITPARAGKSWTIPNLYTHNRDHPRACGEKPSATLPGRVTGGSPPRVRGKGRFQLAAERSIRITPARAGKSQLSAVRRKHYQDHPRACGEKIWEFSDIRFVQGSPPRVRGKEIFVGPTLKVLGITPARAGKSCEMEDRREQGGDHPRACGEKWSTTP